MTITASGTPRRRHHRTSPAMKKLRKRFQYQPLSLKDILQDMKKSIDVMLDLSYSAIVFQSPEIMDETLKIEQRVHELTYLLNFQIIQAQVGSHDLAKQLEPVVFLGFSIDKIADALADIARVVSMNKHLGQFFQLCWKSIPEPIVKVRLGKKCPFLGQRWDDVAFRADYHVDEIAIRRGNRWLLKEHEVLLEGDLLIVKGELPAVKDFRVTCDDPEPFSFTIDEEIESIFPSGDKDFMDDVLDLKRKYIQITDMSETMVELALAALFFGNEEIAEDIIEMEEIMDHLIIDFEKDVLWLAKGMEKPYRLLGLIRIIYSCELISDAAANMAENIVKGFRPHEIIVSAINETDETVVRAYVTEKSRFNGKTYAEVQKPRYMRGFHLVAVKRDDDWIYGFKPDFTFQVDDLLIGLGPKEEIDAWRLGVDPEFDEDEDFKEEE